MTIIDFLIKKKALHEFFDCVDLTSYEINALLSNNPEVITIAFQWSRSPSSYIYWHKLYKEFKLLRGNTTFACYNFLVEKKSLDGFVESLLKLSRDDLRLTFLMINNGQMDIFKYVQLNNRTLTTDKEEKAKRFNKGKLQWSLINWPSLIPFIKGLMFGAKKYGRDNYKKGGNFTQFFDSAQRHLIEIMNGNDIDEESGVEHVGLVMANMMMLKYNMDNYPENDDRVKKTNSND